MAEIDVTTDRRCPGHPQVRERWQMISPAIADVFNGNRLVSRCQLFLMRSKDRIATRVGIGLSRLAFSICANSSAEPNRDAHVTRLAPPLPKWPTQMRVPIWCEGAKRRAVSASNRPVGTTTHAE
jgi:hypothetical protein